MHRKMLGVAVAAALGLAGFSAIAAADPAPQSDRVTVSASELAQLKAQLAQLQQKVAELEQRTDAQSDINVATGQNLEAMQKKQTTVDKLEKLVNDTKISGTMYTDFTYLDQKKNGVKTAASGPGLDVKRFYFSVDHKFNDTWSANLTTDFNFISADGETQLFIKKAYLQGTFAPLATLRVGSANLPWVPYVEDLYGYRFVENTLIDRNLGAGGTFAGGGFGTSADWGLHLLGDNGLFNYQASVINGGGFRNPTRSNSVDFEGRVGVTPIPGLAVAIGGYEGDLGKDTKTTPALHNAKRVDAVIGYNANNLRVGAEYFRADNWKNVTTPLTDTASGYSLWSSYDFGMAAVFGRYDQIKPSKDLDPSLKDTYFNVGVAFPLTKGVRVAVAYKNDHLRDGKTVDIKTREFGAWGEVKF